MKSTGLSIFRLLVLFAFIFSMPSCNPGASKKSQKLFARTKIETVSVLEKTSQSEKRQVLLIHGTPGDATDLADFVIREEPSLEFVAVDRPGFGESEGLELSYAKQAERIAAALEVRGGKKPIVAGHSLGGPIALRLACDFPGKVGGLMILAGNTVESIEEPSWYNYLAAFPGIRHGLSERLRRSNKEIFAARKQVAELKDCFSQIRVPVGIIHGRKDELVPIINAGNQVQTLRNSAVVISYIIRDQGHFIPWQQDELVVRLAKQLDEILSAQRE